MKIAPANSTHLSEIFSLLKVVARDLNEKGINQWNENYPTLSHVKTDLNNSSLYCLIKLNKIIGVISADEVQPKEYRAIKWNQTSGKILVIHRLAVHPSFQKMGIGNKLMDFIENERT